MKGAYVLIIKLENGRKIKVGKLGRFYFPRGYYVYVGSAMNSIEGRVCRHLRTKKRKHWHIDYLLEKGKIIEVFVIPSKLKIEEEVAEEFEKHGEIIAPGFGASDSKLNSHLFYFKSKYKINKIFLTINKFNFKSFKQVKLACKSK